MTVKEELQIFKIGGAVMEEAEELEETLGFFSNLPGRKIMVHGGGRRASQLSRQLGIEARMHEGRRITDGPALEVATMVYAGLENKKVVSRLQRLGCNALGLSGADANSLLARKRPIGKTDYGFAGDILKVNNQSITYLLKGGFTPVFCAITHDGQGQLLNTNADTIAAELSIALSSFYRVNLYYCFEKPGVLLDISDETSIIAQLDPQAYDGYREQGRIAAGMIPKLDNAFRALRAEAASVQVGNRRSLALGRATQLVWTSDF